MNNMNNRFQQLAGITSLNESKEINEKRKIKWGQIIKDIGKLIKFFTGLGEATEGEDEIRRTAANVLSFIHSNRKEVGEFRQLESLESSLDDIILNPSKRVPTNILKLFLEWLKQL